MKCYTDLQEVVLVKGMVDIERFPASPSWLYPAVEGIAGYSLQEKDRLRMPDGFVDCLKCCGVSDPASAWPAFDTGELGEAQFLSMVSYDHALALDVDDIKAVDKRSGTLVDMKRVLYMAVRTECESKKRRDMHGERLKRIAATELYVKKNGEQSDDIVCKFRFRSRIRSEIARKCYCDHETIEQVPSLYPLGFLLDKDHPSGATEPNTISLMMQFHIGDKPIGVYDKNGRRYKYDPSD